MKTSLAGRIAGAPAGVNLQNPRDLLRRFFSIVGFAIFTVLAQPFPATADTDPTEFIDNLGNQALAVLQDGTSLYQKQTYFHQLFDQDFDLSGISRFVLGPYWRAASEPERQEFQRLFEHHVMMIYGPRLADYRGQGLRVMGKRWIPVA